MKVVRIDRFGGPEGLGVAMVDNPKPEQGRVVIDVEAIGVGSQDAMIRSGALADFGFREGFVPGSDVVGTVSQLGRDVEQAWLGRRVWIHILPVGTKRSVRENCERPPPDPGQAICGTRTE